MQLDKVIKSRKSVRKFSDKKPNWRAIVESIDSARYAPMAGGIFTSRFIIVQNKEKIKKIADACQQDFISQTHYVVVMCSDTSLTSNSYGKRADRYARQQSGATAQNFLLSIEDKGLSACWIGHFVDDQIKSILGIPEKIDVEAVFPIGYEYKKGKPPRKIDIDNILYFDKYKNKKMKEVKIVRV